MLLFCPLSVLCVRVVRGRLTLCVVLLLLIRLRVFRRRVDFMCRLQGPWFLLDRALQERSRGGCCDQEHVSAEGGEILERCDCPQAGCCVHSLQRRCRSPCAGSLDQGSWESVPLAEGCVQVLPGAAEQPEGERRGEGSEREEPDDQPCAGEPRSSDASSYLPCSRSRVS